MSTAAWTIVGVFVGAVLPVLAAVWTDHGAAKRADADRTERRATRLFDAKRTAFETFQSEARLLIDAAWDAKYEGPRASNLGEVLARDEETVRAHRLKFGDLTRALEAVRLYASPATMRAAGELHSAVETYTFGTDPADAPSAEAHAEAYDWACDFITSFATEARADLAR
ncbi:hypothetical protein ACHAAC_06645 [Aeromicrobium sp. CF4.19]|uniref:hypothetical protein n=1 Tax=Aeromicrobium sp. CF4.19 TaxID=3373082 RepID=UPI003EE70F07